jgi:hypothetical protein
MAMLKKTLLAAVCGTIAFSQAGYAAAMSERQITAQLNRDQLGDTTMTAVSVRPFQGMTERQITAQLNRDQLSGPTVVAVNTQPSQGMTERQITAQLNLDQLNQVG